MYLDREKETSYVERICRAHEENRCDEANSILGEAINDVLGKLTAVMASYPPEDVPIVIACMSMISDIEKEGMDSHARGVYDLVCKGASIQKVSFKIPLEDGGN